MKAERYADKVHPDLRRTILEDLPYWSYHEAMLFYARGTLGSDGKGTGGFTVDDRGFLAANDRFYLLTCILNRKDASNEWCYDRCREVEEAPDEHLDLWARYHYKSTIITFAGTIQEIINDPEITIAIFGNDVDIATPFLTQIMEELERNDELKLLYPDVFWQDPRNEAPVWSRAKGFVVKRTSNPKELTVQAFGIMAGLPTGGHWRLRIYDDIVTFKSVSQTDTDQIGKTVVQWEMSQNLGVHEGGRRWHAGTRYHFADAYGVMMERRSLTPRIHPATHDGTMTGRPVFLKLEEWEKVKRDQRKVVAAQMLLNPLAGQENTFFMEWLRAYELRPRLLNVYILGDPAGKPRGNKSDRTALAVIGIDANMNRYLLDGFCHRMRLSERWDNLRLLFTKWKNAPGVQMVRIGYERYGMQSDEEFFEEKIYAQKIEGMSIDEVAWVREGPQSKLARIGRLEPYFKESNFWMPPKVWHPDTGVATWRIQKRTEPLMADGQPVTDKKSGALVMVEVEGSAEIVYTPYKTDTKAEEQAKRIGEAYRVMEPIRRRDQDGNVYDLFRVFLEEYRLHPFAPFDDFIDAVSRIQDVNPAPPQKYERTSLDQVAYADT